jgi:tetratricopeptide (TPR) repeat protein
MKRALDRFIESMDRILTSGVNHRRDLPEIYILAASRRLALREPREALEVAGALVRKWRRRIPASLGLLAQAQFLAGNRGDAIHTLEEAVDLGPVPEYIERLLENYREMVAPDLVTFESIDAALERPRILVREGDAWRYFVGAKEPSAGLDWTGIDFDDGDWNEGPSGFGFDDGDDRTVLLEMVNRYTTLYIRRRFPIPDPARVRKLLLRVRNDDGFVAYVNGREVGRFRAGQFGSRLDHDDRADGNHEALTTDELEIPLRILVAGENVLALQGLNRSYQSSDFSLIPEVQGIFAPDLEYDRRRFAAFRGAAGGVSAPARLAYLEGRLLQRVGREREALDLFRKAGEGDSGEPLPVLRLAQSLRVLGRNGDAADVLQRAMDAHVRVDSPLLDVWARTRRDLGQGWPEMLASWPRRAPPHERVLVPTSERRGVEWRFTTAEPRGDWKAPGFDDSSWSTGPGGFGRKPSGVAPIRTPWSTGKIWLRRGFEMDPAYLMNPRLRSGLRLRIQNDDDVEIFINGEEVHRRALWSQDAYVEIQVEDFKVLRRGKNVLAVHCSNSERFQFIDVGLIEVIEPYE